MNHHSFENVEWINVYEYEYETIFKKVSTVLKKPGTELRKSLSGSETLVLLD